MLLIERIKGAPHEAFIGLIAQDVTSVASEPDGDEETITSIEPETGVTVNVKTGVVELHGGHWDLSTFKAWLADVAASIDVLEASTALLEASTPSVQSERDHDA